MNSKWIDVRRTLQNRAHSRNSVRKGNRLWSGNNMNVFGEVSTWIIGSPTMPCDAFGTCKGHTIIWLKAKTIQVCDSQPISMAVAMVATVLGASFRFSMCPDIWLSSSTAYLNMKGTITLVIWEGEEGAGKCSEKKKQFSKSLLGRHMLNGSSLCCLSIEISEPHVLKEMDFHYCHSEKPTLIFTEADSGICTYVQHSFR